MVVAATVPHSSAAHLCQSFTHDSTLKPPAHLDPTAVTRIHHAPHAGPRRAASCAAPRLALRAAAVVAAATPERQLHGGRCCL